MIGNNINSIQNGAGSLFWHLIGLIAHKGHHPMKSKDIKNGYHPKILLLICGSVES